MTNKIINNFSKAQYFYQDNLKFILVNFKNLDKTHIIPPDEFFQLENKDEILERLLMNEPETIKNEIPITFFLKRYKRNLIYCM